MFPGAVLLRLRANARRYDAQHAMHAMAMRAISCLRTLCMGW